MERTFFGKALFGIRLDHNEVMHDMADKLGVSVAYLSAVERGKKPVPSSWPVRIASLYDLKPEKVQYLEDMSKMSPTNLKIDLKDCSAFQRSVAYAFTESLPKMGDEAAKNILGMLGW
jgi:transcriptional regulator with XRE-family HTH domain